MSESTIEAGVTSTGLTVNAGDTLYVFGSATETSVSGQMIVSAGGWSTDTTVEQGGRLLVLWGDDSNEKGKALQIKENGGCVDNYGEATFVANTFSNLTLAAQSATVHSGTVADRTTINTGAILNIYSSGLAYDTVVNGGYQNVSAGGVAERTTISAGGLRVYGGVANNAVLQGGALNVSGGGIANSATASAGTINVLNGGLIENTTADYADDWNTDITIAAGGSATGTTLKNGVRTVVNGTMTSTTVSLNGYGQLLVSTGGVINDTIYQNGTSLKIKGGTANNTEVNAGAAMHISEGGIANSTTLTGANAALHVSSGAVANDTTVNAGAAMHISGGGIANNATAQGTEGVAGKLKAYTGGEINSATINAYGEAYIYRGAVINSATVNSGGQMHLVDANGTGTPQANSTIVNGGIFAIQNTGVARDTLWQAGSFIASAGATIIGTTVTSNTLDITSEFTASNTIAAKDAIVNVAAGVTTDGVTVLEGGSATINATAIVSNLNLQKGGVATVKENVTDGTIGGTVYLAGDKTLENVTFAAGADVIYSSSHHFLTVDNADANAEGFSQAAKFELNANGYGVLTCNNTLFLNGNTVSTQYVGWNMGDGNDLYAGKAFDAEDNGEFNGASDLKITTPVLGKAFNYIYGGGKVEGACTATITGDSKVYVSGISATRAYAGYDVLETAGTDLTLNGNSTLTIAGGTFDYIRGGVAKSDGTGGAMTVNGNALTVFTGTAQSIVGDYQVGKNATFTREGNTKVIVQGGTSTKVTGSVVGAGVSFGGTYTLNGDAEIWMGAGGTLQGDIYGGISVGNTGTAIADSANCTINGNTSIFIDSTKLPITIGEASSVTSIFVGSYAKGAVTGTGTLTIAGTGSNLNLRGIVEFIGDSSAATNKKSYVGESKLVFDRFSGELAVQNIAAFDSVEFKNGSQVELNNLVTDKLAGVSQWNFNAGNGQTGLALGGDGWNLGEEGFFAGDTLNLSFSDSLSSWTLMEDTEGKGLFNDLNEATIKFNGQEAAWNEAAGAFCSGDFGLKVNENKLILSKLASV